MQKPSRSYWLLQLAVWSCLCLAKLPESSAEQIQGSEGFEIGLEVISSKLKKSTHTVQLFLTNRSKTAIDPAQYRLKVLGTPDPTLKVYVKNTLGKITELALNKPINLASLIGIEALPIGAVSQFTLIVNSTKATRHLQLILSIENVPGNTVSKPVEVTWPRKPPQTRFKILIGAGLIALAAAIIMLRRPSNPDFSPSNIGDVVPNVNLEDACLSEASDSLDGLCLGAANIGDQIVAKIGDQIANIVDQIGQKIGERPVEQGSSAVSPQNSELAKLVYNRAKARNTPPAGSPSTLNTPRSGSTTFVSLPRISDKTPEDHRSVPKPTSHSDTSAAQSRPPVLNVSPAGVGSRTSRLQTWLAKQFIRGSNSKKRNGKRSGPEQDTPRTGSEEGKVESSGPEQDTSQRVSEEGNGGIPQKSALHRGQAGQECKKQASFDELAKEGPPTLGEVYNAEKQFTFPESKPELEDKDKGQVPGRISQAADQLKQLRESGAAAAALVALVKILIASDTEQQLSTLKELSRINGAQAILESLSKDIDSPGLVFLPLIELSKEKLEKAIQYLQPAVLIMALTQHNTWKSFFPEVMPEANKFLINKLSPSDQGITTHSSGGPEPSTAPLCSPHLDGSPKKAGPSSNPSLGVPSPIRHLDGSSPKKAGPSSNPSLGVPNRIHHPDASSPKKGELSELSVTTVTKLVEIIIEPNTEQQLSALEGLSQIDGAQAILESLSKDIDSPGLVFLPLIELSKEKLEKAIQYLQPAVLIMALTQHKTWKSSFSEVMERANKFLKDKLSASDQDLTTHLSGGPGPNTHSTSGSPPYNLSPAVPLSESLLAIQPLSLSNGKGPISLSPSPSAPVGEFLRSVRQSSRQGLSSHSSIVSASVGESSAEDPISMLVAMIIIREERQQVLQKLLSMNSAQETLQSLSKDIEYPILEDLWGRLKALDRLQTPYKDLQLKNIIQSLNPLVLITKILQDKTYKASLSKEWIVKANQFLKKVAKLTEIAVVKQLITIGVTPKRSKQLERLKALMQMQNAQQALVTVNSNIEEKHQWVLQELLKNWRIVENLTTNWFTRGLTQVASAGRYKFKIGEKEVEVDDKAIIRSLLLHYRQDLLKRSSNIVTQATHFLSC